ncbi:MAG TPA: hypothetical protein PKD85_20990, partial [Saprospiraceae bacterium]|nr:hypothetical protein [Saprospiraceae bacterium]
MKNFLKNLSKLFIVNNDLINKYETPKKLDDKSNRVFRFKFEGKKLDLNDVRIGDEVNFWYKPDTDFVHFYLSGYTLGDGYIGKILSKNLQKQYP